MGGRRTPGKWRCVIKSDGHGPWCGKDGSRTESRAAGGHDAWRQSFRYPKGALPMGPPSLLHCGQQDRPMTAAAQTALANVFMTVRDMDASLAERLAAYSRAVKEQLPS